MTASTTWTTRKPVECVVSLSMFLTSTAHTHSDQTAAARSIQTEARLMEAS